MRYSVAVDRYGDLVLQFRTERGKLVKEIYIEDYELFYLHT